MALALVGIGIQDEDDISIKGLEVLRTADLAYGELYTCPLSLDKEKLNRMIGKKVVWLERKQVEEEGLVQKDAASKHVAFLVGGDPLAATTHHNLILECKKKGIKTKVFHSSSIFSAIAETGLFLYKFGKTVSLPTPSAGFNPTSPYENIVFNKKNGMHSLILLDIDMDANKGLKLLKSLDREGILENTKIVIAAHLGENSAIAYGKYEELENMDFGPFPHSILIPGDLHFHELDYLELFRVAPSAKEEKNGGEKTGKKEKSGKNIASRGKNGKTPGKNKKEEGNTVDAPITF